MKQLSKRQKKINQKKWEERLPLIMAFLIPLFIGIIVCIDHGVYPFGEKCILKVDMYHQYAPFFSEMWHKIHTGESMFYSWDNGMGSNFISLMAYYLASPANWFLIFIPQKYVPEFMNALIILKLSASSLSFTYYVTKHFNTKKIIIYSL